MSDKLSADIKSLLENDSTKKFLLSAQQFVGLLENKELEKEVFYAKAHAALIDLYSAGHKLEPIGLKYSSHESNFDQNISSEYKNADLISGLGEQTFYWEIFNPNYYEKDGNPGKGWEITDKEASQGYLSDDFADIYSELKTGLLQIDIGTDEAVEDALWQLKWSFIHHWGNHCIDALSYLHYLFYDGKQTF
jgi:hypothetical protein